MSHMRLGMFLFVASMFLVSCGAKDEATFEPNSPVANYETQTGVSDNWTSPQTLSQVSTTPAVSDAATTANTSSDYNVERTSPVLEDSMNNTKAWNSEQSSNTSMVPPEIPPGSDETDMGTSPTVPTPPVNSTGD